MKWMENIFIYLNMYLSSTYFSTNSVVLYKCKHIHFSEVFSCESNLLFYYFFFLIVTRNGFLLGRENNKICWSLYKKRIFVGYQTQNIYKYKEAGEKAHKEIEEIMGIFHIPEIKNKIRALCPTYSKEKKKSHEFQEVRSSKVFTS